MCHSDGPYTKRQFFLHLYYQQVATQVFETKWRLHVYYTDRPDPVWLEPTRDYIDISETTKHTNRGRPSGCLPASIVAS